MKTNQINFQLNVRFNKNLTEEEAAEELKSLIRKINTFGNPRIDCKIELRSPISVTINEAIKHGNTEG